MGEKGRRDGARQGAVRGGLLYRGASDADKDRLLLTPSPQVGIGTPASPQTSIQWYKLAAENGDKRADKRLKNIAANGGGALARVGTGKQMLEAARREEGGEGGGKESCVVM